MKPIKAVKLSIANIISDGLDDVLPPPIEIELLKNNPNIQERLETISTEKINSYLSSNHTARSFQNAFDQLSIFPISHILVPKKEAFDFRKIAIIRPEDLVVYHAIAAMIAEPFEKARSDIARGRIFSHRFKPNLKRGQLFSSIHNIRNFQATSVSISKQDSVKYIVKSDIANFYDRINIHRVESILLTTKDLNKRVVQLINQILLHWAKRNSYGLPIGSNGSRILAEVALYNVDRSLKEAGLKFIRFVDDYRIFTRTATEAHSALAMLIELLDREGLFINTRKSSIERLDETKPDKVIDRQEEVRPEKINIKEFRIFAGYGGTIPIKFRAPNKRSQEKYLKLNLDEVIKKIQNDDFAQPEQLRDVLYGMIIQEKYSELLTACDLVEMFPQFYPLFVDILIKKVDHIPQYLRAEIVNRISSKIKSENFLSEFIKASLIQLVGHREFFERDSIMHFIRDLRWNAGTYLGRATFDAAQNLSDRGDALEVREYFDRSNDWERRRIIRLMSNVLPEGEYRAWRRAIRPYVAKDPFAAAI